MDGDLQADEEQIATFVNAIFRYAEAGTYVSLRGFDQFRRDVGPTLIEAIRIADEPLGLIRSASGAATSCANMPEPAVFAPPVCCFSNERRARETDVANGVALSVELDEGDIAAARQRLEGLLGPATVVVASGGEWIDQTGEAQAKLHLHFRLSEPTRTEEEHGRLRLARDMACRLTGGDPTGKAICHPYRWPGSWNTKAVPVLARIVTLNAQAEIHLAEAIDALSDAIEVEGLAKVGLPRSSTPEAPLSLLQSAMAVIPNPGREVHYDAWIRLGYAIYRATGGSDDGKELFDQWARKSDKYNEAEQNAAWDRINKAIEGSTTPPRTIGAGTIFYFAAQHGWQRPKHPDSPPVDRSDPDPIVPLGYDRGQFFYLSQASLQVHSLTADRHTANNLIALASFSEFWADTAFVSKKGKLISSKAADWLMHLCYQAGIFDVDRVRGRGAWFDDGHAVLHLGDRLFVDGCVSPLYLPNSSAIYPRAKSLSLVQAEPLVTGEAVKIVHLCERLRWAKPISARLFAGWMVCAQICGALSWRPSIWVTGGTGTGKTWLMENILTPVLGSLALQVQSKTTEAGIRQALNSDALPVVFEEFEAEDRYAAIRVQGVLDLMRQSSSETGRSILKGTQQQMLARVFRIRSCFAFSSINVAIAHAADQSRVTVMSLLPPEAVTDDSVAAFQKLVQDAVVLLTPEYAAALLMRSVRLLPIIRANAKTFASVVAATMGSHRLGDQLGALLAGAYSLHSSKLIEPEAAREYVANQDWGEAGNADLVSDEMKLLSRLCAHRVRLTQNDRLIDLPLGRLISAAVGHQEKVAVNVAEQELRDRGIRVKRMPMAPAAQARDPGIFVSTNHPAIAEILEGTQWAAGWSRALARIPGAKCGRGNMRFGLGHQSKAVWLPLSALDQDEEDTDSC